MSYFLPPWETQFNHINSSGNVSVAGQVTVAGNIYASTIFGDIQGNVVAKLPAVGLLDVKGNITGAYANMASILGDSGNIGNVRLSDGNVTAIYFIGNGSQLTGVTSTLPGSASIDIINGNVSGNLINVANVVSVVGNIGTLNSANIIASGQVNVTGNVVSSFFIGDGSRLSGVLTSLPGTVSIDIANGNVAGNLINVANVVSVVGNIGTLISANIIASGQVNVTGNVVSSLFIGNSIGFFSNVSSINAITGNIGNIQFLGGNLAVSGQVNAFGNVVSSLFIGNSIGTFANVVDINATGNGNIANVFFIAGNVTTSGSFIGGNIFGIVANVSNINTTAIGTGNIGNVRLVAGNVMTSGSFIGGNIFGVVANVSNINTTAIGTGNIGNVRLVAGNVMTSGSFIGGNIFGVVANVSNINTTAIGTGNIGNVRLVAGNVMTSGSFIGGNIFGVVANVTNINTAIAGTGNIANVRFASGNVMTNGQVSAQSLFLSTGVSSNNMIFLANIGNVADNNVTSIGMFGSQMRFSTIGGSNGYTFTQFVPSIPAQVEVANLNYFGGAIFRSSAAGAIGTQVINTNTAFTGTMLTTDSATASSTGYNHVICKSAGVNVFRVSGSGATFNVGGTITTGADYAEFFEWEDQNVNGDDRRGKPVVLSGKKIKIADASCNPYDIIGAVSTNPTVIGDSAWNGWEGLYEKDKYGQAKMAKPKFYYVSTDPTSTEEPEECSRKDPPRDGYIIQRVVEPKVNKKFNPKKAYVNRQFRQEWSPIGLIGKVRVDKTFLDANIVHPSWKILRMFDESGEEVDTVDNTATVVEMLIGVAPTKPDTAALQTQVETLRAQNADLQTQMTTLQTEVSNMKKTLNL
ncbi:Chlorovirus glycoprotein repeat domain-containing protein [Acanthocystis turfacea Chlorella virus MN0810.1]|nr:Chlorovirus glycoprotein repeat domain-containing protein [Acanthocystis turfacea Chlorella virus MN0810.1]